MIRFEKTALKNGLEVYVNNTKGYNNAYLELHAYSPLSLDPSAATLIAELLILKNKKYPTKRELNIALENQYGATIFSSADKLAEGHIAKIGFGCVTRDLFGNNSSPFDNCLEILAGCLQPDFDQNEIDREKRNLIQNIKQDEEYPGEYADKRFLETLFPGALTTIPVYGSLEKLEGHNKKSLDDYFRDNFTASNIKIFAAGDFKDDLIPRIDRHFSNIHGGTRFEIEFKKPKLKKASQLEVIESKDIKEAQLIICYQLSGNVTKKDYVSLRVMSDIYNKLLEDIRESEGLTYHISSYIDSVHNLLVIKSGINPEYYEKVKSLVEAKSSILKSGTFNHKLLENAKIYLPSIIKGHWFDALSDRIDTAEIFLHRYSLEWMYTLLDEFDHIDINAVNESINSINFDDKRIYALLPKK
jgi:predicted Zn-dependent peptidase